MAKNNGQIESLAKRSPKIRSKGGSLSDDDLVAAGFNRLDREFSKRPPKIAWGRLYNNAQKASKVEYLEKLAASMNHAAQLIQDERDELGKLCEMKEAQIQSLKGAIEQNNNMIQGEITRMNEDRQLYNAEIAKLRKELREMSGGNRS